MMSMAHVVGGAGRSSEGDGLWMHHAPYIGAYTGNVAPQWNVAPQCTAIHIHKYMCMCGLCTYMCAIAI